jgi:serine phosphatase RsbU (regulator of sigma subunit)
VIPFFAMAVVAAADLVAGPQIGFLPLLSLGPALAPVALGPGRTVLTGVLALLLSGLLARYDGTGLSLHSIVAAATIVGVTGAGFAASTGRQRKERELVNVRAVADAAQRVLLHPVPARIGGVQVAVRYISAAAAARIGGDLYDMVAAGGRVRMIIADVQGKGLPAVQTAAVVLGAFRESAHDALDLTQIADQIELSLTRQAPEEKFVTAVLAEIVSGTDQISIVNCGHPPPLLITGTQGQFADPPEASLPLGLAQFGPDGRKQHTVKFGPKDRILFYTDGISEARDNTGTFYPVSRCATLLAGPDLDDALGRLYADVFRHTGGALHDDSAALLMTRATPRT